MSKHRFAVALAVCALALIGCTSAPEAAPAASDLMGVVGAGIAVAPTATTTGSPVTSDLPPDVVRMWEASDRAFAAADVAFANCYGAMRAAPDGDIDRLSSAVGDLDAVIALTEAAAVAVDGVVNSDALDPMLMTSAVAASGAAADVLNQIHKAANTAVTYGLNSDAYDRELDTLQDLIVKWRSAYRTYQVLRGQ